MVLPPHLQRLEEQTCVYGDVDKFIKEIEQGLAAREWERTVARNLRMLNDCTLPEDTGLIWTPGTNPNASNGEIIHG